MTVSPEEKAAIFRGCRYSLSGHPRPAIREVLHALAAATDPSAVADLYGKGSLVENFEKKIAGVLGFPATVFMPSGTMAQTIALRIWSERRGTKSVGFHPLSHLEIHEQLAYSAIHGLQAVLLGDSTRLLGSDDLRSSSSTLAALLLELPQRELGGILPSWDELLEIRNWACERNVALHMDGARLWESQPFYGKTYAEIAGLFDSVYVSFYKGIGGIAGAILAGDEEFIKEAKIWQRRHGGNLVALYPYIISAEKSFDARIGKMAQYHAKALEIAEVLSSFPAVTIAPARPQTNMMRVLVKAPAERLNEASLRFAQEHGTCLFREFAPARDSAELQFAEIHVGDSSLELSREKLQELFGHFFKKL